TFVYPNAAPQASVFNQSKDLWLGVEDHVLRFADTTDLRVSVFTAPVLEAADPLYRNVQIPRRFWKVAVWLESSPEGGPALGAAGFVLDQSQLIRLDDTALPVARLGSFRTFQAPIGDIGSIAGIDFGHLVAADVIQDTAVRSHQWIELTGSHDIRL
ncbi:MAG TPA: DNA/RNA non-specific endonuclease, partial [Microbacterium sp.]|nr:DNA/RNA non-specific endonuclease [Microbacterium sp.]